MSYTYQLPAQFCHTNGPLRWLPSRLVDHYLLLLLRRRRRRSSRSRSSSISSGSGSIYLISADATTPGTYRLLLQYRLLVICHPKGANTTPVIVRQGLPMLYTTAVLPPGSTTTRTKVKIAATFGPKISAVWANFTKF